MLPINPCRARVWRAAVLAFVSSSCEGTQHVTLAEASARPVEARPSVVHEPDPGRELLDPGRELLGTEPPAPGRWRLVPPETLERSLLWLSHILIRHRDAPRTAPFSVLPVPWTPQPDAPARSRAGALELALDVAARARAAPHAFAELARQYSEDATTRDTGGSLGGVDAATFIHWPRILDALAALRPGDVSRPIETPFGFHVFSLRDPPAASRRASGRRIVIGYDEAPWLGTFLARRPIPKRTRGEAERLARELFLRARARPEEFSSLVAEFTEHQDALRDGDFGSWSNLERAPFPQAVERLHSLEVGEVGEPLDSMHGFQIIMRTPDRERQRYAMQLIQLTVDPLRKDSELEAGRSWAELQRVARALARDPSRFTAFQSELCCSDYVEQWEEGRGSVRAERALTQLRIGQTATEPADLGGRRYAIVARVEPLPEAPRPLPSYGLPAPEHPDALAFCADTACLEMLQAAKASVERELSLPAEARSQLAALHAFDVQRWQAASNAERLALLRSMQPQLATLLGRDGHVRYQAALTREAERILLQAGPPAWR